MTVARFVRSLVMAPIYGVLCLIVGMLFSWLVIAVNFLIHLILGLALGSISAEIDTAVAHLPIVLALLGIAGSFMTETPIRAVFGTARWADRKDRRSLAETSDGLLIGRDTQTGDLLRYDGPAHLLTMAPTRTGKGVGTVIPNLLTADRSVICIDPKGENARITFRARQRFGPVHVLDPFGITGRRSDAFNPLDGLDANGVDVAEDAGMLADALVHDEPGMAGEAHWNEEAKALIAGLILYTVAMEAPGDRHLGTLRKHLTLAPQQFAALLARMQEMDACDGLIARAAGVNDVETAELIGKAIGKTDAVYTTQSWSEGKTSTAQHIAARDLINPDEIMRMPGDRMILLRQGQRPVWARKLRYFVDAEFKG